jgi:hypothetical protein
MEADLAADWPRGPCATNALPEAKPIVPKGEDHEVRDMQFFAPRPFAVHNILPLSADANGKSLGLSDNFLQSIYADRMKLKSVCNVLKCEWDAALSSSTCNLSRNIIPESLKSLSLK